MPRFAESTVSLASAASAGFCSRRVLVCVAGVSPAVITETLFALGTQPQPFVPDEIHVITTTVGLDKVRKTLLLEQTTTDQEGKTVTAPGHFYQLMADYPGCFGATSPRLDDTTLHVIAHKDSPAQGLADIVTQADNRAAAQTLYRELRQLKAVPGTQVHASVAGGRKTMSFYMGQAFSLLADEGDVLSHVLVNEPFEQPGYGFFYPPPQARELSYTHPDSGKTYRCHTQDVHLELAHMSVLKLGPVLRQALPPQALEDFDTTVNLAQALLNPPVAKLRIHTTPEKRQQGQLVFSGVTIDMAGVPFVLLALHAMARAELGVPIDATYSLKGWNALSRLFDLWNLRLEGGAPDLVPGFSRIATELEPVLGKNLARIFKVQGPRGSGARAVSKDAPPIELEGFDDALLREMRLAVAHMAAAAQAHANENPPKEPAKKSRKTRKVTDATA